MPKPYTPVIAADSVKCPNCGNPLPRPPNGAIERSCGKCGRKIKLVGL